MSGPSHTLHPLFMCAVDFRTRSSGRGSRLLNQVLLSILLASLSTGGEVGGNIQPVRVIATLIVGWALVTGRSVDDTKSVRIFLLLGFAWLAWATASLFWTPNIPEGINRTLALLLGFVVVLGTLAAFRLGRWDVDGLRRGWVFAFVLTLPIAAGELLSDLHLPNAIGQTLTSTGEAYRFASATFGNKNNYVCFSLFAFPFILWSVFSAKSLTARVAYLLCAAAAVLVGIANSSRTAMLSLPLQVVLFFALALASRTKRSILWAGVIAISLAFAAYYSFGISDAPMLRYAMLLSGDDESFRYRRSLVVNGLHAVRETYGLGAGAGSTSSVMDQGPADTHGLVDPHNLLIEVASQYGVLIFGFWVYCLLSLGRRCLLALGNRTKHSFSSNERWASIASATILLTIPIIGNANSHLLSYSYYWAAMACIVAVSSRIETAATSSTVAPSLLRATPARTSVARAANTLRRRE